MPPSKHTPTPWEIRSIRDRMTRDVNIVGIFGPSEIVANLDGIAVPDRMNDRSFVEDRANMELIVRAVNSHDALVSALEKITAGTVDVSGSAIVLGYPEAKAALDAVRTALALVEHQFQADARR